MAGPTTCARASPHWSRTCRPVSACSLSMSATSTARVTLRTSSRRTTPTSSRSLHVDGPAAFGPARSAASLRDTAPVHVWMETSTILEGDALTPLLTALDEARVVGAGWRGADVDDDWRGFHDAGPGEVEAVLGYLFAMRRAAAMAVAADPASPFSKARFYRNVDLELSFWLRAAAGRPRRTGRPDCPCARSGTAATTTPTRPIGTVSPSGTTTDSWLGSAAARTCAVVVEAESGRFGHRFGQRPGGRDLFGVPSQYGYRQLRGGGSDALPSLGVAGSTLTASRSPMPSSCPAAAASARSRSVRCARYSSRVCGPTCSSAARWARSMRHFSPPTRRSHGWTTWESLWGGLDRGVVFPSSRRSVANHLVRRHPHLYEPDGVRALVRDWIPLRDLAQTQVPCHVVTTDLLEGRSVLVVPPATPSRCSSPAPACRACFRRSPSAGRCTSTEASPVRSRLSARSSSARTGSGSSTSPVGHSADATSG